jgi:hypothetical protein
MTQDEIILMARQAGFGIGLDDPIIYAAHERFAKLVAQHEREACAQVAQDESDWNGDVATIADLIRARGQA